MFDAYTGIATRAESSRAPALPRNAPRRRVGQILLGMLVLTLAVGAAGSLVQIAATEADASAYPAPGALVDVGGYRLHIYCLGDGSPTVILEHVGDGNSAEWALVQPEIATRTRVCAYDRAGFGWSDPGRIACDAQQATHDLPVLLHRAGVPGPFVLVGHSYGANVARLYVAEYPDEVTGMVLVDPGTLFDTPGVSPAIDAAWRTDGQVEMRLAPLLSRVGVLRLAAAAGAMPGHGHLPEPAGAAYDRLRLTTRSWDALAAQNRPMPATSTEVLGASRPLGRLPLMVLSASQPDGESRRVWTGVNASIAMGSSNSVHLVVDGATHMAFALDRSHAQATVDAISRVTDAAGTGRSLVPPEGGVVR